MTYTIAEPCVDVKDKACIEECPVDCIYEGARMLYIHPDECVDCGACEPVCPVFATYHNDEGMNVQVYNRCIGTRYCSVNCPYTVRMFNYWEPKWPKRLRNQLNPDVTIRTRGIMEKCSFCVQRLRRGEVNVERRGIEPLTGERIPTADRKLDQRRMKEGN
mgnify:CR=1 FL=1